MGIIIFDFDGTIADTRASIIETMRRTLEVLGLPSVDDDAICSTIGLPLRETFVQAIGIRCDAEVERAVATYREQYAEVGHKTVCLFQKVTSTLDELKRRGITMAVASSRSRQSLDELLDMLGVRAYFSYVLGEHDVTNKKPAPDMVLKILDMSGNVAADALVVGDTQFDISMGQKAGCVTCGVTYGNHSAKQLREQGADYVIDDFSQVLNLV